MPEKVVCDASPLIFLAKIRKSELLDHYKLYIPSHVKIEVIYNKIIIQDIACDSSFNATSHIENLL
jgi:hypothetical protein